MYTTPAGSAHLVGAFLFIFGATSISLSGELDSSERSILFARRRAGILWEGGASIPTPERLHGPRLHHVAVHAAVAALGAHVVTELGP